MTKRQINPASLFPSLEHGFPQGVVASGSKTLYVSGQTAWDAQRRVIGGRDLAAQARQAFRNLRDVIEAGGARMSDVVSLRLYIVGYQPEHAAAVASAFREAFPTDTAPATTWIGVAALASPDFLIEVEATAVFD